MTNDGYAFYVIENNVLLAGFSVLRPLLPFTTLSKTATISTFIENRFRHKGYGKMLLQEIESAATKRGISLLLANILSENKESMNFHSKHGFTECGRFHNAGVKFNIHFDMVWMEKTPVVNISAARSRHGF